MSNKWLVDEEDYTTVKLDDSNWIKVKSQITAGDYEDIVKELGSVEVKDIPASMILKAIIVDWSFVDSGNVKIPINRNSLRRLVFKNLPELIEKVNQTLGDQSPFGIVTLTPAPKTN